MNEKRVLKLLRYFSFGLIIVILAGVRWVFTDKSSESEKPMSIGKIKSLIHKAEADVIGGGGGDGGDGDGDGGDGGD
jgi:hypothetical protein